MQKNVGNVDRLIRVILGLGLLSFALIGEGPMRWWGLIGLVPLLTAAIGTCPLYSLLGLSTCPLATRKS